MNLAEKFEVEYDGWGTYFEDPNGEDGDEDDEDYVDEDDDGVRHWRILRWLRLPLQNRMDYPQILAPVLNFLQCPTPQAWIDKARDPANLPLLLTDHMVCELSRTDCALLVRKYVADESGADALLDWLKPYEVFTFRDGPEPDFIALHKQIGKSVMPKTDDPWGQLLIDSMVLLIKEELHHFWQVREAMLARDIPYVKITASRYAKGMLKEVRTHEPLTLIDKLSAALYRSPLLRALRRTGAVPRRRFAEVLPVAAALGSAIIRTI
jgi:tRNA isopentenyl-2-thiomethyl-A-37 hydroxylase MiaE